MKGPVISVFTEFARNNFFELFTWRLKRILPQTASFFNIVDELLPWVCCVRQAKQQLVTSGAADHWANSALEEAACGLSLAAINLLCSLWLHLPTVVAPHEDAVVTLLQKGCRNRSRVVKFSCMAKLFQLLQVFSDERNEYGPVIYKTLVFSLFENYEDILVREFLLSNFVVLFRVITSIPVGVLVEPLVKQLQMSTQVAFSVRDFELLVEVGEHPRLLVGNAVQVLDLLAKMYVRELGYSKLVLVPFLKISQRFSQEETVQEFLVRFVILCLKLLSRPVKDTNAKLKR